MFYAQARPEGWGAPVACLGFTISLLESLMVALPKSGLDNPLTNRVLNQLRPRMQV